MDAKTLENGINAKYGKQKDHQIDENVSLIRKFETGEIVILDSMSSANGHHLLKDASKEEIEKIAGHFKKLSEKDDEDDMIPGGPDRPLTPQEERQQKKDNELIADGKGDSEDNELIPD